MISRKEKSVVVEAAKVGIISAVTALRTYRMEHKGNFTLKACMNDAGWILKNVRLIGMASRQLLLISKKNGLLHIEA